MKLLLLLTLMFIKIFSYAQNDLNIIPTPAEIRTQLKVLEKFKISKSTLISYNSVMLKKDVEYLVKRIKADYGISLQSKLEPVNLNDTQKIRENNIVVTLLSEKYENDKGQEYYNIYSGTGSMQIIIQNSKGLFYAIQTLLQVFPLPGIRNFISVPMFNITDYPRFPYRGMHLDVGRHFFSVPYIKKYIDYLAAHKFNTFHWHLTEDQGWRIEIKKYPKLTEVGGCRAQTLSGRYGSDVYDSTKYCGFYTQKQIREIVKYAADRYITVIPEIEMPGHSLAALASYPFLGCTKGPYKVMETWGVQNDVMCAGNDSTFTFLQNVLDEVMDLFPSRYIHIGGDESPKDRWKECPQCQRRIQTEGLNDEHGLQSYFIQRVEKYLNKKGRKIIGWDEILEGGLAPNATVMSWRGTNGGIAAAKQKHDAVMTPETPLYLNHSQSRNEDSITQGGYNPLEAVYNYEPVPAALDQSQAKFILGAQGNVWTEYISNVGKLEYSIFPRMSALAEVLWSPASKRSWSDFERRLPALFSRYRSWGANYSNAFYDLQPSVVPFAGSIRWKLETKNKNGRIIYVAGHGRSATFDYTVPLVIKESGSRGAALTDSSHHIISSWVWQDFFINLASGKKTTLTTMPSSAYPGSGAFTLVDGVHNTEGMVKSAQFLGFFGTDMEAVIDLDSIRHIAEINLHAFEQKGSWIYRPASVLFFTSDNGISFESIGSVDQPIGSKNLLYKIHANKNARYIKINAKNYGTIPHGMAGSGNKAWLFVDEIEVK